MGREGAKGTKVHLVHSEDEEPQVSFRATPGKRFEVSAATVVDTSLQAVADEARDPDARPATLCAGHGTCIAIIEIEQVSDPTA